MKMSLWACAVTMILAVAPMGSTWAGTEGSFSTFYGNQAGLNNSADTNGNTFVGASSGKATTTGQSNAFLGGYSGASNTTGSYNVFLGYYAGRLSTSADDNVFVGDEAGYSNTTGHDNNFFGWRAGYANATGNNNSFMGDLAGRNNTSGYLNVFLGSAAGFSNTTGYRNTAVGVGAGYSNVSGHQNVFLGHDAGLSETGSHKLYIDNCNSGGGCTSPFIYGEFDNHLLKINGVTHVSANSLAKSQLHFSLNNADSGGFLTSVLENNFFMSSGARYDGTAGGWIQRSADQQSVIQGSGGLGYRIFTSSGNFVGNIFVPTLRLHIDYSGQFGINTAPVAGHEIHASSGAHLTAGGVWTDASSREYKEHIRTLGNDEAQRTLAALSPVRYSYKVNPREQHVGFIAEDVPELVAREDRKSLSPMDIVAVLTKVLQEKSRIVDDQQAVIAEQQRTLESIQARLATLETALQRRARD